jgi:hypothetical protein
MTINAFHPMRRIIEAMQAIDLSDPDALDLIPLGAQVIFLQLHPSMSLPKFFETMQFLESTPPSDEELEDATVMLSWSLIEGLESGLCHIAGHSVGHPIFDNGVPVRTSPIVAVDCDKRWARSWNRFYRMLDYQPGAWRSLQIDGYNTARYREVFFS